MAALSSGPTELVTVVQPLRDLHKKNIFKKIFSCILIVEFVIRPTQGPTWESIMNTDTMQTLL